MADVQREIKMKRTTGLLLHGERVYLHRPTIDDAANVFYWERDDEVWRYDPHRPYSHTMAEFLPIFKRNYIHGGGHQCWFIIEDEEHVPIGTITYFNVDTRLSQAEIGLGLGDKTRWGQGYGPDAIVPWFAICSHFHIWCVSMQRRLWPIIQPGVPLPKLVLSKLVKFSILAVQANHGYCWKYTDQMRGNVCRLLR